MSELFLSVVNMSISASWLIAVVLVLRFFIRKAPKWVNVLLWGIVGVRLLCPFSIESALSLIPSTETIPQQVLTGPSFDIQTGISPVDDRVNEYLGDRYFEGVTVPANNGVNVMTVLALIWAAGVILMLVYTAVSYWRLRRRVDTAVCFRDNIFQSENIASPFVLGIIRPRIYLPFALDKAAFSHVVAHEMAHIQRRDHWWKPLGFLLLTIHWFNPLMWLGYVLLCRDIELACDEKVIGKLEKEQRADYTQSLVSCSTDRRVIAACPLAFGEVGVKERVRSVLNYKKPAFWIVVLSVIACAAVAVCFLTDPKVSPDFGNVVSVCVGDDETPVSDEGKARLIELLERYRKYSFPVGADDPNDESIPVRILFSDGSDCLLHYYYYDGISWDKLLSGEGNFYAVLTYWRSDGSVDAWKMEKDFNEAFQVWCDQYCGLTEPDEHVIVPDPETDTVLEAEKLFDLDEAISAALLGHYSSDEPDGLIHVESHKLFANEVMSGTPTYGSEDRGLEMTAYLVAHQAKYSVQNGTLTLVTAWCIPTALTFTIGEEGEYILKDYWEAPDGEGYANALYDKFPPQVADEVLSLDCMPELIAECEKKALAVLNSIEADQLTEKVNAPRRPDYFSNVMGYSGYIVSTNMGSWSLRSYYAVVDGEHWLIAESFGFGENGDYVVDVDGDGVTELIANIQYGSGGGGHARVYQRKGNSIYVGTLSHLTEELSDFNSWGAGASWSEYDSADGVFRLYYSVKNSKETGVVEVSSLDQFAFQEFSALSGIIENSIRQLDDEFEIGSMLTKIQSSPAFSSNPGDYIEEHREDFDMLVDYYGAYTMRYCFLEFMKGGQNDLRGHIMAAACREIAEKWGEGLLTAESSPITGQKWFDTIKANALSLSEQYSADELEAMYPASYLLLIMMGE